MARSHPCFGQEFAVDVEAFPDALDWLRRIFLIATGIVCGAQFTLRILPAARGSKQNTQNIDQRVAQNNFQSHIASSPMAREIVT